MARQIRHSGDSLVVVYMKMLVYGDNYGIWVEGGVLGEVKQAGAEDRCCFTATLEGDDLE